MPKHKQEKLKGFNKELSVQQKAGVTVGAVAVLLLSAHATDVASTVTDKVDSDHGVVQPIDPHHHIHDGDILVDRRQVAQYNSEEKSTNDKDRDNWEIYENALKKAA